MTSGADGWRLHCCSPPARATRDSRGGGSAWARLRFMASCCTCWRNSLSDSVKSVPKHPLSRSMISDSGAFSSSMTPSVGGSTPAPYLHSTRLLHGSGAGTAAALVQGSRDALSDRHLRVGGAVVRRERSTVRCRPPQVWRVVQAAWGVSRLVHAAVLRSTASSASRSRRLRWMIAACS